MSRRSLAAAAAAAGAGVALVAAWWFRRRRREECVDGLEASWVPKNATARVVDCRKWPKAKKIYNLGSGDSELHLNVFEDDSRIFDELKKMNWYEMSHRGGIVPRLVSIQAKDDGRGVPVYRHPADKQPPTEPFHPTVLAVAQVAENISRGCTFNHCLVQRYRGGSDYISEHSDKTLDVLQNSPIVNVSFGATRVLTLRSKKKTSLPRPAQKIVLPHNSIFFLGPKTNRELAHSISRDGRRDAEKSRDELREGGHRISLTLRTVATFQRREDHVLIGQGAPHPPRPSSEPGSQEYEANVEAMIKAFSAENRQDSSFDWDAEYGRGFAELGFEIIGEARDLNKL